MVLVCSEHAIICKEFNSRAHLPNQQLLGAQNYLQFCQNFTSRGLKIYLELMYDFQNMKKYDFLIETANF